MDFENLRHCKFSHQGALVQTPINCFYNLLSQFYPISRNITDTRLLISDPPGAIMAAGKHAAMGVWVRPGGEWRMGGVGLWG